jgi:hypothetical protein
MKHFRIALIILSIVIVLSGITYFGWIFYLRFNNPTKSPLQAIPENTALIIKLNRPTGLWADMYRGNLIWKEISAMPYIASLNDKIHVIDSLLKTNKKLYGIAQKSSCYVAMTLTGRSTYGFLFLTSIPGIHSEGIITSLLEESYGKKLSILKNQYGSSDLVRVSFQGQTDPLYFAVRSGVFLASQHPELIRKAIDQLSLNLPSIINTGFQKVESTTGKKVDANIYINYHLIHPFIARLLQSDQITDVDKVTSFADWSGLDVILKKDELLINGFTTISDTGNQYLRIFSSEAPQKVSVTNILPDNTSRFMWVGFSEIENYYRNFLSYSQKNEGYLETYPGITKFENENQVSAKDYLLPWIGNEICLSRSLNDRENLREDIYAVIKVKDLFLADSLLSTLQSLTGGKKDSLHYKNQTICTLAIPDLIPSVFGRPFRELTSSCYSIVNEYIVFGNSPLSLKYFIDHVVYKKVLNKNKAYITLNDNLSDNTNLYYYFNTERIISKFKSVFSDELNEQFEPALDTLKKFESLTVQFTSKDGVFYSNIYVRYNPVSETLAPLQWQVKLDTLLLGKPQYVSTGSTHENIVLAFDVTNRLYQIDSSGMIRWKLQIPGKPMGLVQVVYPKNKNNACYLFNTDRLICLVDESGHFIPGFPHPLPARASGGLLVNDMIRKGTNTIFIALADNKIHALNLDGTMTHGWINPTMQEGIFQPVQFLENRKTDFVFIKGKNGHILVTDKKGKTLLKPGKDLTVSKENKFYINKTNNKGTFLTTDPSGKIIYLRDNWKNSEATFNLFSPAHLFFYEDINDDGKYEFIFYDKGKLYFYDHFYKLRYSYVFRREITVPPFLIQLPDGRKLIAAVSGPANEIYLFGKDGLVELEPGIHGNTAFSIGSFGKEEHWNLVIGSGKSLKNYRLPK